MPACGRRRRVGLGLALDHETLVVAVHERRRQQKIRRRPIAGDRHVVHDSDTKQRLDVDIVRLRFHRIPEEDDEIDSSLDNTGADLLVAAERPAQEAGDRQSQLLAEKSSGRTGRVQLVLRKRIPVVARPLQQLAFAIVMCDERHELARRHRNPEIRHIQLAISIRPVLEYPGQPDIVVTLSQNAMHRWGR